MKKVYLMLALALAGATAYAQKPTAGDVTAEVSLNLAQLGLFNAGASGNPFSLNNGTGALRGRYFLQDNLAIRAGLNITTSSTKTNFYENADGTGGSGSVKLSSSTILITPGIEKHFNGAARLSTYAGADLMIAFNGASEKWENTNATGDDFGDNKLEVKKGQVSPTTPATAGIGLGLRVVAGADYYVLDNIYLGAEFGWGYMFNKVADAEVTATPSGAPSVKTIIAGGSNNGFVPSVNAGIRLGFIF